MLRPTDLKEVRDAVLDSAGTVAVVGAGTAGAWAGALEPVDAVLDLGGLTGVITHNPGDMTVSVRAGTPLRALNAELAEHGQHVAFDAARVGDGATVGGLVSTADGGPARAGARHPARPRHRHHAGARGRHRRPQRRPRHQERRGLRPRQDRARRLRHPRGDRRGRAPAAPGTAGLRHARGPLPRSRAAEHATRVLGGPFEPAALEWVSDPAALLCGSRAPRPPCPTGWRAAGAARRPPRPSTTGDAWASTHASPAAPSTTPCCGSACGRRGCRRCWPRCRPVGHRRPRHRRRDRRAAAGPDVVAAAHDAVHAAGGTSVLRSRPAASTAPAWGPPRPRWACSGRSRSPSTRRAARAGPVHPVAAVSPDEQRSGPDHARRLRRDRLPQTAPSAFDPHRPPERELLDDCVHCGFCLPTCPTYQLWGEEMDSPRGRIYLMNLAERARSASTRRSPSTSTPAWAAWPA